MPKILATILSPRMLVSFLMGFSCGLPLLLTIGLLQAWMKEEGLDLGSIGLISLLGLPYTLKFIWAPLTDRYTPPFLGRRRGWLLTLQVILALSIVLLGQSNPGQHLYLMAAAALCVTFFSASQDIVVDAYRREDLTDEELGLGSSLYVYGYRIGMLLAGAGGMILADHLPYSQVYLIMALCMAPGIITTLLCSEPNPSPNAPKTISEAVIGPFKEFFLRSGVLWGFLVLGFILFFKLGDSMASAMTTPFFLDIGFSKSEIGAVGKLFGFWATLGGLAFGGILLIKLGIIKSLFLFGVLQAISTAGFAVLAYLDPKWEYLAAVIAFENLTSGMGTSAFLAYIASLTDKRFTATQFALLSALTAVARVVVSATTGFMVELMGWSGFFWFCAAVATPGLLLLIKVAKPTGPKA
ncbi:AmpG family muropeptide MFS transporter [Dethiosulfatarculus sandiegensis]|uniref:AmpG protein n=1 Tax=Dethiosulfatarculus sandiegensis TaxID=1429043 RepID=A0A0D2JPF7_9BACT|nr:AmpG family muropeptide MFS transporter [Dethiosulfatarculus sandiegensis]KIX11370.1 AmpG protein [Dethiosulfatarculus sandiegensis]